MRKKQSLQVPVVELDVELSENWQQPDMILPFPIGHGKMRQRNQLKK